MRIALISDNYPISGGAPPSPPGGIGTYTQLVAEELVRLGHSVHVIAPACVKRHGRFVHSGVTIWQCPAWSRRREMTIGQAIEFSVRHRSEACRLSRFSVSVAVREAARGGRFDVIETPEFGALGDLVPRRAYVKLAARLHLPSLIKRRLAGDHSSDWTSLERAERELAVSACTVTAPSAAALRMVEEAWGVGLPLARVIGNPIRLQDLPKRDLSGVRESTVVFFGRLEAVKGVDVLAAAIPVVRAKIPTCRFRFIGPDVRWGCGKMGSEIIRDRAGPLAGGAYTIEPSLPREELLREVAGSTVAALPSRVETFGLTLLEAMAIGVPTVASDIRQFIELSDGGRCAILHRVGDVESIAERLTYALTEESARVETGSAASQWAKQWAVEAIVKKLLEAWS